MWQRRTKSCCFAAILGFSIIHLNHRNTYFSYLKKNKRNRQNMLPCLSMLSQRLWKLCLKLPTTATATVGMVILWACIGCKITRQPFHSFATGDYYVTCRWELGIIASSAGRLVNTANESPSHHFICSRSCTEPRECCCERSKQQQTCIKLFLYNTQDYRLLVLLTKLSGKILSRFSSEFGNLSIIISLAC